MILTYFQIAAGPDFMKMGPTLTIGGRGRRRGIPLEDPNEIAELREQLMKLTPEQRETLKNMAHARILNSFKSKVP